MVQRSLGISLAPVTWARPISPPADEATLAFRYLVVFRRVVISLALVGAALAWAYQLPALTAALLCVGIGELLESSYYIGVLRWRQAQVRRPDGPAAICPGNSDSAVTHQDAPLVSTDRPLLGRHRDEVHCRV